MSVSPTPGESGLFWTVSVAPESVSLDLERGTASFRMHELEVPD